MTLEDMTAIIKAFEGKERLEDLLIEMGGASDWSLDGSCLGKLNNLSGVVMRNWHEFEEKKDDNDACNEFWGMLRDKKLTPEEKAKKVMGITEE